MVPHTIQRYFILKCKAQNIDLKNLHEPRINFCTEFMIRSALNRGEGGKKVKKKHQSMGAVLI